MHRALLPLLLMSIGCHPTSPHLPERPLGAEAVETIAGWRDPAPHRSFRVSAGTVKLHYLDFGGVGPPLVFLSGLGDSAHVFDGFAPRFTDRFHVYALTRRGHGESEAPVGGYDVATLAEDIVHWLDALRLERATFVGHSIAGDEVTLLSVTHPERVERAVFLDAAYDHSSARIAKLTRSFPEPPMARPDERLTVDALRRELAARFGFQLPEASLRASSRFAPDGTYAGDVLTDDHAGALIQSCSAPRWGELRVPALAVYAAPRSLTEMFPWTKSLPVAARIELEKRFVDTITPDRVSTIDAFTRSVERGTVVEIAGASHYLFTDHPDEVERAMRAFFAR